MINRRELIGTSLATTATVGLGGLRPTRAADTSIWKPIVNGEQITINDIVYDAECGTNPIAIQRSASGVLRFTIVPGNMWKKDGNEVERTEIDGWRKILPYKDPIWSSWSMFYELGEMSTSDWCSLNQYYQSGGTPTTMSHLLKPGAVLHWIGADPYPMKNTMSTRYTERIPQGVWIHYVETVKFDPDNAEGYWKSWVNGRQVVDFKGGMGAKGGKGCYRKFGIYRGRQRGNNPNGPTQPGAVSETFSIRYANMRFTTDDLSKLIKSPEPTPAFEPYI